MQTSGLVLVTFALFGLLVLLALSCRDEAVSPPSVPLPETTAVTDLPDLGPDPDPPFDFRRAILHPERHRGIIRTCIVRATSDGQLLEPGDPLPVTPVRAHHVRCAHSRGVYEVRVVVEEAFRDLEVDVAPIGEPPRVRRLSLSVVGIDEGGRRPVALLRASSLVADPHLGQPPRAGVWPTTSPSHGSVPQAGFDFGRAASEPALVGSRQPCAIRAASYVVRARPGQNLPEDVTVTMPATCAHLGGRSNATLLFTEETVDNALLAGTGAVAHGTVESLGHLRVIHVTAAAPR